MYSLARTNKIFLSIFLSICMVCMSVSIVLGVPGKISYQGKLTDDNGVPIHGPTVMHFKIYVDGYSQWSEDYDGNSGRPKVTITNGHFSVQLGSLSAIPESLFNTGELKLGIAVGTDSEMSPRISLLSNPYAFHAGTLDGLTSSQFMRSDSGNTMVGDLVLRGDLRVTNNVQVDGKMGIGTSSPSTLLHVKSSSNGIQSTIESTANWAGLMIKAPDREFTLYNSDSFDSDGGFGIYDDTGNGYRMVIDSTGLVGIGTTNPSQILDVAGNINFSGTLSGGTVPASLITGLSGVEADPEVGTNTTNYIPKWNGSALVTGTLSDVSSMIGVGVAAPTAVLDVGGGQTNGKSLRLRSGDLSNNFDSNQILFSWSNGTDYTHAIKTRHRSGLGAGNAVDFYVWNQGVDSAGTIGTKHVMTLDNGNVGIGITSPSKMLHVKGTGSTDAELYLDPGEWDSVGDYGQVTFGDNNHYIRGEYGNGTTVYDVDKINLLGGDVGVGTSSPSEKLHVAGDVKIDGGADSNFSGDQTNSALRVGLDGGLNDSATDKSYGNMSIGNYQIYIDADDTDSSQGLNIRAQDNPTSFGKYRLFSVMSSGGATRFSVLHAGEVGYASHFHDSLAVGVSEDNSPAVTHIDLGKAGNGDLFVQDDIELDGQLFVDGTGDNYFAGNVGIGTTSPGQKLTVAGTIESTSGGIKFPDSTVQTTAATFLTEGSVEAYIANDVTTGYLPYDNGTQLITSGLFWDNSNSRAGIGTSLPRYTLDVRGSDIRLKGDAPKFRLKDSAINGRHILMGTELGDSSGDFYIRDNEAGVDILGYFYSSPKMVLMAAGGNVGIGKTSPSAVLDVAGDVKANYFTAISNGGSEGGEMVLLDPDNSDGWHIDNYGSSDAADLRFFYQGVSLISMKSNGDFKFSGSLTEGTVPDARLSATVTNLGDTIETGEITSLVATKLTGTIDDARLSDAVTQLGNTFNGNSQLIQLTDEGKIPVLDGSGLTALNASELSSGTVPDARLSATVTNLGDTIETGEITSMVATKLTGTIDDARLSATVTNLGDTIETGEITSLVATKLTGTIDDARLSDAV
ncbi:hypothetical protein DID80_05580, partial [Candidatus Marinamargulisbacteria bacterium SCGC AAA071-K20]